MDETPLNQLVTWMSRFFNLRVHQKHLKPVEAERLFVGMVEGVLDSG